ncbi:hypothetical protein R1flu_026005 [Riccia fluitans]|uniref:Uncharacterized protein n=1 Tax=Riccia fluitans TaxID=41844 RepID=A0ABD1XEQ3_9MARC
MPLSLLQIEEVVEASDSDEQDKGNSACRRICLESETAGPGQSTRNTTVDRELVYALSWKSRSERQLRCRLRSRGRQVNSS